MSTAKQCHTSRDPIFPGAKIRNNFDEFIRKSEEVWRRHRGERVLGRLKLTQYCSVDSEPGTWALRWVWVHVDFHPPKLPQVIRS